MAAKLSALSTGRRFSPQKHHFSKISKEMEVEFRLLGYYAVWRL
jgi:hypothetical protein